MDKPIPEAVQISDEMVERACKRYAFREDGATFPDDYSEYEVLAERKLMRDFLMHVLAERLTAAQQQGGGEAVAWCALTPSGKIAYFDGSPMVMVGPVGNEHHTTPLYTAPPSAPVGVDAPLSVFSAGTWTYETGQVFSADDLDGAAFAVYRPHLAQQPAAVDGSVVIDGRRYDVETVRTALLGLAADYATQHQEPTT